MKSDTRTPSTDRFSNLSAHLEEVGVAVGPGEGSIKVRRQPFPVLSDQAWVPSCHPLICQLPVLCSWRGEKWDAWLVLVLCQEFFHWIWSDVNSCTVSQFIFILIFTLPFFLFFYSLFCTLILPVILCSSLLSLWAALTWYQLFFLHSYSFYILLFLIFYIHTSFCLLFLLNHSFCPLYPHLLLLLLLWYPDSLFYHPQRCD